MSIRDIKDRIVSVEKTKKITQAMKMVSAAKFKRHLRALNGLKAYGSGLQHMGSALARRLYNDDLPELMQPSQAKRSAVIVLSSDRGLCGGFNVSVFKALNALMATDESIDLFTIGQKSAQFYAGKSIQCAGSRPGFSITTPLSELTAYMEPFIEGFLRGQYGHVRIVYNGFVSALSANQVVQSLLPVTLPDWNPNVVSDADFIYESSKVSALNAFCRKMVMQQFMEGLYNSLVSEEGFRMAAMDSASTNAKEMISELTLFYNRSRQAAITTELTEIVAGAASIT
jgi:F-type H+-transporting ATPase subunit gamma